DLGSKEHIAIDDGIKERLDAEAIADRDHRALAFVGDDHRELAAQFVRALHATLLVKMQRDFAVAFGREAIAGGAKPLANLAVAIELAVHHQVHRAVGTGHRLIAIVQADDRQARMSERPKAVARGPASGPIGPAMEQDLERRVATLRRKPAA